MKNRLQNRRRFLIGMFLGVLLLPTMASAAALEFFPSDFDTQIALASSDPRVILARIINAALLLLGVAAVALTLYGGFLWMTASGNEERIATAKKTLTRAAIGLAIVLSSFAITRFVLGGLLNAIVGEGGGGYQSGDSTIIGSLPRDAFTVRGITPTGAVPIRNIAVRVVLSRTPNADTVEGSVVVRRRSDDSTVDGTLSVSGSTIKFTPSAACPDPNADRKCFDADTDYTVEVRSTLQSVDGKTISCGGFAPACEGAFRSGAVVDVSPPEITFESPDPGESVPVDSCVPLQARVKDDGGVSSVEFFADGVLIDPDGTVTPATVPGGSSPTEAVVELPCWDTTGLAAPSTHQLRAKVYDIDENTKTSATVRVVVRSLHCFNGAQDDEEDGPDCDSQKNGPSGCGLCDGGRCSVNEDCAGGMCDAGSGACISAPKISGVSPEGGRPGTFVTVSGLYFGASPGRVIFTDNKDAQAPSACSAAGSWTSRQALVAAPDGSSDGPVKLCTAGANALCDSTNDARGPIVPVQKSGLGVSNGSFDINETSRPGLCLAYSPTPNTACEPGTAGDAFCRQDNKDPQGNPDASAFCHPQKRACVFPKGVWHVPVYLEGAQFGRSKGYVSFSGQPSGARAWNDTSAETVLPPLSYGDTKVQAIAAAGSCRDGLCENNSSQECSEDVECAGLVSNAVEYVVLSPDAGSLPVIDAVNPAAAGPGSGITLVGKNFGDTPGIVWFQSPDGRMVQADVGGIPEECSASGAWWADASVTVKVPRVSDSNDFDKDGNKTEALVGNYQIFLRRYDSAESNTKAFAVNTTPPPPMIWCLDPAAGPAFTNVTVYGERFGSVPVAPGLGVFFAGVSAPATLVNVSGTPGGVCPPGGWSDKKICVQAGGGVLTGNAIVKTLCQGVHCDSNGKLFTVGACNVPATIGTAANPAYAACSQSGECCADGICRASGKCAVFAPEGGFGWKFTTSPTEIVPRVVEECVEDATDTTNLDGRYASPSPWVERQGGDKTCVNAQASARFTAVLDPSTLGNGMNHPNVLLEKCAGGTDADNLFANGGFETSLAGQWRALDGVRLALTRVEAAQDDLLDDGQTADGTIAALRLEKLTAEPDRSLGQKFYCSNDASRACVTASDCAGAGALCNVAGNDGNEYRDSFAAAASLPVNPGQSYAFSIFAKAAKTRVGPSEGKMTAVGQKAGVSVRIFSADGEKTGSYFYEKNLTQDWQELKVAFDLPQDSGARADVRLYLVSPKSGTPITDYHLYAAYFDDARLMETGTVSCQTAQEVPAALLPNPDPARPDGFSLLPSGGSFEINTWYRVTLKTGIKAQGQGALTGAPMRETSAHCGAGNAYCWLFKTGAGKCAIGNIWTVPNPFTAHGQDERVSYDALPVAKNDACINLNPAGYAWNWASSDPAKAEVDRAEGRACVQESDCALAPEPVGNIQAPACRSGHCSAMPWTSTVTAKTETAVDDPVKIIPSARDSNNPDIGRNCAAAPECSAKLFIQFADPKVVEYWPSCGAACRNAEIGAKFNIPMDAATLRAPGAVSLVEISCGNGVKDAGEDCDDGNTANGDGCSDRCVNEGSNFTNRCGNGSVNFGEDCDDGNAANGDGCGARCLNEGVINGQAGGWSRSGKNGVCGNGIVEDASPGAGKGNVGEECDDGNIKDADGCSARCLNEGTRSDIPVCGNARVEKGEECDRGASGQFDDWCDINTCVLLGSAAPTCGNGAVDAGEECDPASALLNSAAKRTLCSAQCLWTGTVRPTQTGGPGCGNGKTELGEDCDDGNVRPGDGCGATCLNEGAPEGERPVCGNGKRDAGEDCDDGNVRPGDGCGATCLNEGAASASCGNGIKETGEDCDWFLLAQVYGDPKAKELCDAATCRFIGKSSAICGNGRIDDGEACDGTQNCSSMCTNTGREGQAVPLASVDVISGEAGPDTVVIARPLGELEPLTPYRVMVNGSVKSQTGKPLTGLNLTAGGGTEPNAFSWIFTTQADVCAVDRVEVNPSRAVLSVIGASSPYTATPWSAPDSCSARGERLSAFAYGWEWNSENPEIAAVSNADTIPQCGDGRLEWGESCDDGNAVAGDGCSVSCLNEGTSASCGNGKMESKESCDDGNAVSGDFCNARCLNEGTSAPACGNGTRNNGEDCDDGNRVGGDGCNARCLFEGTSAATPAAPISPASLAPNMGGDPYQQATAVGLSEKDVAAGLTSSTTALRSAINNTRAGESESLGKIGGGTVTVQCGRKDDMECAQFAGGWKNGRGSDSCCRVRPWIDVASSPTGGNVCRNALLTAVFSEEMDPATLSGNMLLARKYEGVSACPAGTVSIDDATGRVISLVQNGSFENAEGWEFKSEPPIAAADPNPPIALVGNPVHTGSLALKEAPKGSNTVRAVKRVTLAGGIKYRLSAFYQVKGSIAQDAARLSVRRGTLYEDGFSVRAGATPNNWSVIYRDISPPTTGEYTIELIAGKGVEIYWDDVALSPLGNAKVSSTAPMGVWEAIRGFVFNLWRSLPIFPASSVSAQTTPVWCIGDVTVTEVIAENFTDNGGAKKTKAFLKLNKALEARADYKVHALGDPDLEDNMKEGALSAFGVAMNADVNHDGRVQSWSFTTGADICTIDRVDIDVSAPAGSVPLFINKANDTRELHARAISLSGGKVQEITSIGGYGWEWNWNDSDDKNAILAENLQGKAGQSVTLKASTKNGEVTVTAAAKVTDASAVPSEKGKEISGSENFTIFICENPWPARAQYPYKDALTNFSFGYCRDAGKAEASDDLPAPAGSSAGGVTIVAEAGQTPGTVSAAANPTEKANIVKEILLPFDRDVIGIRVMENYRWLSPAAWYRDQGFIGDPQPLAQPIDGYEAVQDGTTVYIAAANAGGSPPDNQQVYSNIYLISYNPDARAEVKNIRDQIVNNFRFNINLAAENLRVCERDANIGCSFDAQCLNVDFGACNQTDPRTGKKGCERNRAAFCRQDSDCKSINAGTCRAARDKLSRDVRRVKDALYMAQALENSKTAHGTYPQIEAGSFLRGLTNSRWPSWSSVLGNALGAGIPTDPLNETVGLYGCEGAGYAGYEKNICWNASAENFKCPAGSQIYQYRALGPDAWELAANFEFADNQRDWVGLNIPAGNRLNLSYCAAGGAGYGATGFCGDGVVQPGEACETGETRIETCSQLQQLSGSVCLRKTNQSCSSDSACGADGPCVKITTADRVAACKSDCSGFDTPSDCRPSAYCGDGRVDAGEICDSGTLNGQYGKCNRQCAGFGGYCGDGKTEGPEKCDDKELNGQYGKCRTDCTGIGERCGDGVITAPNEQCDPRVAAQQTSIGYCLVGKNPCTREADCASLDVCAHNEVRLDGFSKDILPLAGVCEKTTAGYQTTMTRACGATCQWGNWSEMCLAGGQCGNGINEGAETCDDGNLENTDGCTSDCRVPSCGDGFEQTVKVCVSGAADRKWQTCEKDGDCGTGGKCQATETCDLGAQNGKLCTPTYGFGCSYCTAQCQKAFVEGTKELGGGFCGDGIEQSSEKCDSGGDPAQLARSDNSVMCFGGTINEEDAYPPFCSTDKCGYNCYKGFGAVACENEKNGLNTDGDKLANNCDPDDDNDKDPDATDCAPFDATRHKGAPEQCNDHDMNCNGRTGKEDLGCVPVDITIQDIGAQKDDEFSVYVGAYPQVPHDGSTLKGKAGGASGGKVSIGDLRTDVDTYVHIVFTGGNNPGTLLTEFSENVLRLGSSKGFCRTTGDASGVYGAKCEQGGLNQHKSVFYTPAGCTGANQVCHNLYKNETSDPGVVQFKLRAKPFAGGTADDTDGDGIANSVDCKETNPDIYPGADEICDDIDNNCNNQTDETCSAVDISIEGVDGIGGDGLAVYVGNSLDVSTDGEPLPSEAVAGGARRVRIKEIRNDIPTFIKIATTPKSYTPMDPTVTFSDNINIIGKPQCYTTKNTSSIVEKGGNRVDCKETGFGKLETWVDRKSARQYDADIYWPLDPSLMGTTYPNLSTATDPGYVEFQVQAK